MNWEAAAAIGEILGALAVVATVAYLAVQVRQNTASVSTATYESVVSGFNLINLTIAEDEALATIFHRGLYDPDSLSEIEGVRFAFVMRAAANEFQKLLRLKESGALSAIEWERMGREAGQAFRTPGGRRFREGHTSYADLFDAVDRLPQETTTAFRFSETGTTPRDSPSDDP
jgi:hypothetical protein